jgi:hypothetical protein
MKGRKVLIFSRDPGGTNAVMQLVAPLRALGNEVAVFGKDAALSIYPRFNMDCNDIRASIPSETLTGVGEFLSNISPDLIVTGTSSEDFTERYLWKAAEKTGIPSFAVLDQWTNYRLRFLPKEEDSGRDGLTPEDLILPSFVFVMDEFAKKEMCEMGMDGDRLVVTGQPFFDYIRKTAHNFSTQEIEMTRIKLAGNPSRLVLLFASQPIASIHRQNGIEEDHWGYTEETVFKSVFACLAKLTRELAIEITLVIRLHPKDEPNAYRDVLSDCPKSIKVVLDREIDSSLLIMASDLIIGMFSMVLLEAGILKRRFISVQIGLKRESPLIFDRMGTMRSIVTEKELADVLRDFLNGWNQRVPDLKFEFGATERIVEYLEKI